jgi:hypothetical protein
LVYVRAAVNFQNLYKDLKTASVYVCVKINCNKAVYPVSDKNLLTLQMRIGTS